MFRRDQVVAPERVKAGAILRLTAGARPYRPLQMLAASTPAWPGDAITLLFRRASAMVFLPGEVAVIVISRRAALVVAGEEL